MTSERARPWDELQAARPPGWYIGTPVHHIERQQWAMYAYDTREQAPIGKRTREWTAVAPTEDLVVREMARCLREFAAGRVPK